MVIVAGVEVEFCGVSTGMGGMGVGWGGDGANRVVMDLVELAY